MHLHLDFLVYRFKHGVCFLCFDEINNFKNSDFRLLFSETNADNIPFFDIGGSFCHLIVDGDSSAVAGIGGNGAPLDEAADFQVFINSHIIFLIEKAGA